MPVEPFFHIADPSLWELASVSGSYEWSTRDASLADVGYLHCSFRRQVVAVADLVYGDWPGDLVLLEIDPEQIPSEIRVEQVDGAPEAFPHIYGPLPVAAVRAVHPLTRNADRWSLPSEL